MRPSCWLTSCAIVVCAACTGTPSTRSTTHYSPSPSSADAAPSEAIELTCSDAGDGNAPAARSPGDLTLGGLTFEGLSATRQEIPLASEVGLEVAPNSDQHFRKTPAYLRAGTRAIVVQLAAPATGQALGWVPSRLWTSGTSPDLRPWMASRVTFDGCPGRDSYYLGGLLATDPQACLALSVHQTGHPAQSRRLRLTGAPC